MEANVGGLLLVLEEPAASRDRPGRDNEAVASSRDGKRDPSRAGKESEHHILARTPWERTGSDLRPFILTISSVS